MFTCTRLFANAMLEILPELDAIIVTQVKSEEQGLAMLFKGHRGLRGFAGS